MMSERKITNNPNNREEQWRVIYENSPLGIELYDVKGGLIDANRACLDIFGIDDVSAVSGFMLFDDPNLSEQHKKDLREGKPVKQEIFFDFDKVKKDSLYPTSKQGTINLDLSISPLVSSDTGANSGYIVYVSDITLRKNAEAMLLEQKRFAEKVIDSSAVATFVLDRDHKVVLWNGACEELTGAGASEMIGSGDHWRPFYDHRRPTLADIIIDKKHETLPALYEKSSRSALVPDGIHAEGWYSNLNGKDRYIVFDAAPIYDSKNQLIVAIETLQDMTDYKRAEEDLEKRTQELIRSNAELKRFAHVASHDLKAPLLSIGGFAEVVEEKYGDRLDARGRMFLSRIIEGTARMENLINDLLAYAQVTTQARPFGPVNCDAVMGAVLSNLQSAIDESHAVITYSDLPVVRGDETQLVQLFQNLVGNAIKYRRDAPPHIRVSAKPIAEPSTPGSQRPEEHVAVRGPQTGAGREWLFSVSDNGIGIDPRFFEQIFKIFQRVPPDEKKYPGTGIGLAICDKIVERHGGRIWVESGTGTGSTFYFTIRQQ